MKIEELMQQELPNLVDERRFRRREPEQFERDELGRVGFGAPRVVDFTNLIDSGNGPKNVFRSIWNLCRASISGLKLLVTVALT